MRRVDEAPILANGHVGHQPFNWPLSGPCDAVLHFLHLLGNVDMDWAVFRQEQDALQLIRYCCPQAMRGDAEIGPIHAPNDCFAACVKRAESINGVYEPPLRLPRRLSAKAGMRVEYRQERQLQTCIGRSRSDARGEFAQIRVGRAVFVVMKVMELAHPGEPALQHFGISLRRDRFHIVRRHREGKPVHDLAPAPERIRARSAPFGEARHGALKRMAVQIWQARNGDCMTHCSWIGIDARGQSRKSSISNGRLHIALPAVSGQRLVKMKFHC